jgi:membrane-bound lytic murein transglycosylase A
VIDSPLLCKEGRGEVSSLALILCLFLSSACLGPAPRRDVTITLPPTPPPVAQEVLLSPDGARLRPVPPEAWPSFADDGGLMGAEEAVRQSLDYYRSLPPGTFFVVGPERIPAERMARGMETFLRLSALPPADFRRAVRDSFTLYASPGEKGDGVVTFSAYYEHALDAALSPGGEYLFPIYGRPSDLVEKDSPRGKQVGRMEDGAFVPYFTRAEIDGGGALEGKGLEIAWAADPLDIFFLQVQGSGWLRLPGGEDPVRVRFAAHNGHPYKSVGGNMISRGVLPSGETPRKALIRYFLEHPEERQEWLNFNPRYVFFKLDYGPDGAHALGSIQRPLTPRRSLAADKALFAPGALAWMETDKVKTSRFVLIQDEGGAIKGPSRIDYFVGAGKEAEDYAIRFWTPGRFYLLIPK